MPLVSSVSAPVRRMRARSGEPDPVIAAANPAAIESTETKTMTTPAMPIMATADEPSREGIVRRLTDMTAIVCLSQFIEQPSYVFLSASVTVSYTHLRAHETPEHL